MFKLSDLKTWLPLALFFVVMFFLWKGISLNPRRIPSPFIGKPVPSFKATLLTDSNSQFTNNDLKGQVSLLNVFATWCLSCRVEHPVLIDISNKHRLNIYGLDYKDNRQTALKWLSKYGNPYTKIIFDPTGKVGINLGVYGTPETFIIDQKGIIRDKYIGPISPQIWKTIILPIVKKLQRG